jgi:hypothetical protein
VAAWSSKNVGLIIIPHRGYQKKVKPSQSAKTGNTDEDAGSFVVWR